MALNSHNMAIFPHFLAFLVTFLVVRTTFMRLTSTKWIQRPVTHTGCDVVTLNHLELGPSPSSHLEQGIVKIGLLCQAGCWSRNQPVLWATSHLITWRNMYQGHLCPHNAPLWHWSGPKYGYFVVKIQCWEADRNAHRQRWANSVLMTKYEYEYYSTFQKWPNTNTNFIRFEKGDRIRIRILFGLKKATEYEYEYYSAWKKSPEYKYEY